MPHAVLRAKNPFLKQNPWPQLPFQFFLIVHFFSQLLKKKKRKKNNSLQKLETKAVRQNLELLHTHKKQNKNWAPDREFVWILTSKKAFLSCSDNSYGTGCVCFLVKLQWLPSLSPQSSYHCHQLSRRFCSVLKIDWDVQGHKHNIDTICLKNSVFSAKIYRYIFFFLNAHAIVIKALLEYIRKMSHCFIHHFISFYFCNAHNSFKRIKCITVLTNAFALVCIYCIYRGEANLHFSLVFV